MKKVTVWEIAIGVAFAFMGWTGVQDGEMYRWGVPIMHPRLFGWSLIALGIGIPLAAYIMRSRQGKGK